MGSDLYIPPSGVYFRLLNYVSQHVVFSRNSPEPEVYHYLPGDIIEDQWFELLPGSGENAGLYAIKGKLSGKALFSRSGPTPTVGHNGGNKHNRDR